MQGRAQRTHQHGHALRPGAHLGRGARMVHHQQHEDEVDGHQRQVLQGLHPGGERWRDTEVTVFGNELRYIVAALTQAAMTDLELETLNTKVNCSRKKSQCATF